MDFAPTAEQRRLCDDIEAFANDLSAAQLDTADDTAGFDRDAWQRCAEQGLTGLAVPKAYGGGGHDAVSTALALEAFGRGCGDSGLVFSVAAHLLAGAVPLALCGSEAQKERYLPGLCDGRSLAALAMTEARSGSDAYALASRATVHGDGYRLDGHKTWITNGPVADVLIVGAVSEDNTTTKGPATVSAFLVDADAPGVERSPAFDLLGLRSAAVGEIHLDGVEVPGEALLGRRGGGAAVFQTAMDWERTCLFAAHVGAVERLLSRTVRFVKGRRSGDATLASRQAVSHQLADLKVQLEAARLLVYRAAWQLDRGRSATQDAAIAKLFTSETLLHGAVTALRLHGGEGLRRGGELERAYRDAVAATLYSGTSEIQRNLIAAFLGLR